MAAEVMASFRVFKPHLTGAVLSGTADIYTPIRLQLFADTPEEVLYELMEKHIPWKEGDCVVEYANGLSTRRPLFSFQAAETEIELLILPTLDQRNPPINPIDGRPEKGASLAKIEVLLKQR